MNYQRKAMLERIKSKASIGQSSIIVYEYDPDIRLVDEDWDFFEKLGYKVTRPETKVFKPFGQGDDVNLQQHMSYPGRISW